jgi:hypothetical protein
MLKNLLPVLIAILFISNSCAGRQPQPVLITQNGDDKKSCEKIDLELKNIKQQIEERYPKIKDTDNYNLRVGLFGSLLPPLIPLSIFSDIRKADAVELNALQRRNNHLVDVERQNGCGYEHSIMPVRKVKTIFP